MQTEGNLERGPEFRLALGELLALETRAAEHGVSMSAIVRSAVRRALAVPMEADVTTCEQDMVNRRKNGWRSRKAQPKKKS